MAANASTVPELVYPAAQDGDGEKSGLPVTLSIFADLPHVRATMRDDARASGFHVREASDVVSLVEGEVRPLGEVVLVDCPHVTGTVLAALARLDMRVAHSGARLIVSTGADALDDVFGCLSQSQAQLMVDPTRADRVLALARALVDRPGASVRELSEEDRLVLLRLAEQVELIARRMDRFDGRPAPAGGASAFHFESPEQEFSGPGGDDGGEPGRLARSARPPLPDPRMVRRIIRQRQLRARFFDGELFADPAWDMLLDLTAARAEHLRVSVTSLCIASGVPPTTALRWIGQLTEAGLFLRVEDDTDRRRAFIALSDKAADAMARYFGSLGAGAKTLV